MESTTENKNKLKKKFLTGKEKEGAKVNTRSGKNAENGFSMVVI